MPPRVMRLALPFLGVIAVLGVIAAFAWRSPQREPDRRPGVAACPGAYPQGPRPKATRDGDLVARGASVALLCRYPFPNNALGGSTPLAAEDVPRLVERLNGLADARAVCMARFLLDKHKARVSEVPANGERVQLVEIGTHCKGALFLDGSWINTPELESRIDEISRSFDGFYFGRFDIRTPSVDDFKAGRNFKIVELNGVTSEATHIYDPRNSLIDAYRVLFEQWRIAFEIGAKNREHGVKPSSLRELLKGLTDYSKRPNPRSV